MQNEARAMLEGALISGIFLVLIFLTLYTPIGVLSAIALPIPFTVYAARHRLRHAVLAVVASMLLTIFVGALPLALVAMYVGSIGVVMGTLYNRQKKAFTAFMGGLLASLFFLLGSLVVSYFVLNIDPIAALQTTLKESVKMSQQLLDQFGMSNEEQAAAFEEMIDSVVRLTPMILILISAQMSLVNHWLSRKILLRLNIPAPGFPPMREWRWSRSLLYFYFAVTLAALFMTSDDQGHFLRAIVVNLKPILDIMMIIQGLGFVSFFSRQKGWGNGLLIATIVLAFILPIIPFILILLGILDLGIDLRKQLSKK